PLGVRKIRVFSVGGPPLAAILSFHNTCFMNIITYSGACSLFPKATFSRKEAYALGFNPLLHNYFSFDYDLSEWSVKANISGDVDDLTASIVLGSRYIGDSRCWTHYARVLGRPCSEHVYYAAGNIWNSFHILCAKMFVFIVRQTMFMFFYLSGIDPGIIFAGHAILMDHGKIHRINANFGAFRTPRTGE
ncbi:hypothetical protein BDN70DRAFT_902000, partial [Pholiota conissans]